MITKKRLIVLNDNINKSMGWSAKETEQERKEILKFWDKLDGRSSFHDCIRFMINEKVYLDKIYYLQLDRLGLK